MQVARPRSLGTLCRMAPVAAVSLLVMACAERLPDHSSKGYSCSEVPVAAHPGPRDAALAYFRAESGVTPTRLAVVSIDKCEDLWQVLVEAPTGDYPLPRLWYIELSAGTLRPLTMVPPE